MTSQPQLLTHRTCYAYVLVPVLTLIHPHAHTSTYPPTHPPTHPPAHSHSHTYPRTTPSHPPTDKTLDQQSTIDMYMMRNIYDANKDSESTESLALDHQWKATATLDKGDAWAPHWNDTQYQVGIERH